jgi:predicted HTH transcriptional regulator
MAVEARDTEGGAFGGRRMSLTSGRIMSLVSDLASARREVEWVEFKQNNADPEEIGEYLSALSNAAALKHKPRSYLVWGVEDGTFDLVGTTFRPRTQKVGTQELENWLVIHLHPQVHFQIHEAEEGGRHFVVFEIPAAMHSPIRFKDTEYVRVGSYKKKLRDHPELERSLWSILSRMAFEDGIALPDVTSDRVLELLDYPNYFRLMKQPFPDGRSAILDRMLKEALITEAGGDRYHITNSGAILFARDLSEFRGLARKVLRVIVYKGENRVSTLKEQPVATGYAVGFEGAVRYILDQLPQNEHIGEALRTTVEMYPRLAVRELVANALIHQDFTITGSGPTVEIFSSRMEITNPGRPLIDPLRFIDEPPRSRNEAIAAIMRRADICEERGSGIDKVISAVEAFQLPAPDFRVTDSSTVAVLLAARDFQQMDRGDRVRACYQHACLQYVSGKRMTNTTLRQRLGIEKSSYPMASRIIHDAIDSGLVKPYAQGNESKKNASYVPFWA